MYGPLSYFSLVNIHNILCHSYKGHCRFIHQHTVLYKKESEAKENYILPVSLSALEEREKKKKKVSYWPKDTCPSLPKQ